jgi:rsbT co-antagonist protein RsbR
MDQPDVPVPLHVTSYGNLEQRLGALELTSTPMWLFDDERGRVPWANQAAVRLFDANSLADLLGRDFSDMSPASRTRLARHRAEFSAGRDVWDIWTIYPKGKPTTVRMHLRPFELEDGHRILLLETFPLEQGQDPGQLRGVEALRHTAAMVALLDPAGEFLMQNPAAMRAFKEARFAEWFEDDTVVAAVTGVVAQAAPYRAEVSARTAAGARWHLIEARSTVDPVTGAPAILLEQVDVTERRGAELTIALQHQQILALSAPLLAVGTQVLALPIIGILDAERAAQITESLLSTVSTQQIRHVIIDLTGAVQLDAAAAELLIAMTRAIRLLGARPILTGIQPAVAQVFVSTGGDLHGALVLRDLRQALAACNDPRRT